METVTLSRLGQNNFEAIRKEKNEFKITAHLPLRENLKQLNQAILEAIAETSEHSVQMVTLAEITARGITPEIYPLL